VKSEIESALAEAKSAVEGGDPDQMTEKTNALTQAAMKLGQAMYEQQQQQQAEGQGAPGAEAGAEDQPAGEESAEEVVDAEFSEVDEGENKAG